MKKTRLTMAQALLCFLDNQYIELDGTEHKFVQGVMGIFGHGNVTGLGEALEYGDSSLSYIQGNNEQGLVHAATAFAKQKNRLGIFACTSSIGPGATNMISGAASATVNRLPVLLLPGDSFASRQPDPVLQQIETPWDYTINANNSFKPVSRYWDRVERPEQLMVASLNAMRVLTDPVDTGAVTICLPQDVQAEAYDYPNYFLAKRVWHLDRRPLSSRSLSKAIRILCNAKKPLILAGGGVHYAEASDTLRNFAETFAIPVGETQAGKSSMNWKDKMSIGAIGVTGTSAANILAKDADVVLVIGSRLQDFTTSSKQLFNKDVKLMHLNVSKYDALKMDSFTLHADAKCGLESLKYELTKTKYQTSKKYLEKISQLKKNWESEVNRLYKLTSKEGNVQTNIIGILNEFMEPKDVILCAAGSLPGDLHKLWRSELPKTYHVEYGYSCMGYEVAGGLGAKLAMTQGEVYVIVGDGSYLMLHSEFLTALKEHIKINVVLLDNSGYQCIKKLQIDHGSAGFGNEFRYREKSTGRLSGEITSVDFKKYSEALGVKAYHANDPEEFLEALQKTRTEKISTLIEVKVLPGTMTDGYNSWWRVGVPEVSKCKVTRNSNLKMFQEIQKAREY
tara:strand:- start:1222 stop:3087 length:1866 start_codon:yes stop_codon:yes gene_type:complete